MAVYFDGFVAYFQRYDFIIGWPPRRTRLTRHSVRFILRRQL